MKITFVVAWLLAVAPYALAEPTILGGLDCPPVEKLGPDRKIKVGFGGAPKDVQEAFFRIDSEICNALIHPVAGEPVIAPDIVLILLEKWRDVEDFPPEKVTHLGFDKLAAKSEDDFMNVSVRKFEKSGRKFAVVALNVETINQHFVEHAVYALMYRAAMVADWDDENRRVLFATDDLWR